MKFTIGSLVVSATLLFAVTSSSAQTVAPASVVRVSASSPLLAESTSAEIALRGGSNQASSTLDRLLMWALGASLVAIQLRRRQKTFRGPLLRA